MENVENFYSYGDMPPWGKGPEQGKIHGHPVREKVWIRACLCV